MAVLRLKAWQQLELLWFFTKKPSQASDMLWWSQMLTSGFADVDQVLFPGVRNMTEKT